MKVERPQVATMDLLNSCQCRDQTKSQCMWIDTKMWLKISELKLETRWRPHHHHIITSMKRNQCDFSFWICLSPQKLHVSNVFNGFTCWRDRQVFHTLGTEWLSGSDCPQFCTAPLGHRPLVSPENKYLDSVLPKHHKTVAACAVLNSFDISGGYVWLFFFFFLSRENGIRTDFSGLQNTVKDSDVVKLGKICFRHPDRLFPQTSAATTFWTLTNSIDKTT